MQTPFTNFPFTIFTLGCTNVFFIVYTCPLKETKTLNTFLCRCRVYSKCSLPGAHTVSMHAASFTCSTAPTCTAASTDTEPYVSTTQPYWVSFAAPEQRQTGSGLLEGRLIGRWARQHDRWWQHRDEWGINLFVVGMLIYGSVSLSFLSTFQGIFSWNYSSK